jgi:Domain of unknown function (DUF4865)
MTPVIVKQYAITLPADYDMGIIRKRVAAKGASFDTFPGLGLKVFLIREKGRFGAESNQYAPLYLWPAVESLWGFVAGEAFKGVTQSFGWVPIKHWLGLAFAKNEACECERIRSVTREDQLISAGTDLMELRAREVAEARRKAQSLAGLMASVVAINPDSWELVRFDYWSFGQSDLPPATYSYEVLHVSAPNFGALN